MFPCCRLLEECKKVPEVRPGVRCPTGKARITPGCDLPARFVIHTGVLWAGGGGTAALGLFCHHVFRHCAAWVAGLSKAGRKPLFVLCHCICPAAIRAAPATLI